MSSLGSLERPSASTKDTGARLAFLDVVRGLAATLVMVYHSLLFRSDSFRLWSRTHFDLGQMGVVAFFLVSGFVIPFSLERRGSLSHFWKGRFLRLYPLYWITLLAALLLAMRGLYPLPPHPHQSLAVFAAVNATMFQDFLHTPTVSTVYWTLPLEMFFYVACSLAFRWDHLRRTQALALLAFFGMFLLDFCGMTLLHRSVATGRLALLATCFFGTVLYRVSADRIRVRNGLLLALPYAAVVLHGYWLRARLPEELHAANGMTFSSAALSWTAGCLLFLLALLLRQRRFPAALTWLGRVSYSLYLIHPLVIPALPASLPPVLWGGAVVLLSCALAQLSYTFIEAPLIGLYARSGRRADAERSAPATPLAAVATAPPHASH